MDVVPGTQKEVRLGDWWKGAGPWIVEWAQVLGRE